MIQLRDYQSDLIQRTRDAMRRHRNVLMQAPTGAGKTALTVHMMATAAARGKTCMFLVHQSELLKQTSAALWAQHLEHGMIAPGKRRSRLPVQVASVQTLVRRLDQYDCPDLIVIDECMTGDTQVDTDNGPKRIDRVSVGDRVMCYDGHEAKFSSVSDTWCSGEREIFEVHHSGGEIIRCTGNHRVWTDSGWKRADSLNSGDLLLIAHADVEKRYGATNGGDKENTFSATKSKNEDRWSGSDCTKNLSPAFLSAPVGVVAPFEQNTVRPLSSSLTIKEARHTTSTSMGTPEEDRDGVHRYQLNRDRQSWGLCLATRRFSTLTPHQPRLELSSIMGVTKENGRNTRLRNCIASEGRSLLQKIRAMDTCTIGSLVDARNLWLKSMEWWCGKGKRLSPKTGLTVSEASVSPGGYAMTDHVQDGAHAYTPRDSQIESNTSSETGSAKNTAKHLLCLAGGITKKYQSLLAHSEPSSQLLKSTSQNACNTSWSRIESVRITGEVEKVYDITVPETGNFFANGVLVHNCHRAAAATYIKVLEAYPGARVVGLTATPARTDGKPLGDMFDAIVEGPSIRSLIDAGYLADYTLAGPPGQVSTEGIKTQMGDYNKKQLEEAVDRPTITGDAVAHYQRMASGKRCVVMCVSVKHAEHVAAQYRGNGVPAACIEGSMSGTERQRVLDDFRAGRVLVLCNVALMVEGVDLPAIEVVQWLRPTQSLVIWMQGNGRGLRPAPGKQRLLILDHVGNWQRHGIPDEEREWSLAGRQKAQRGPRDPDELDIQQCQECYAVFRKGPTACPSCGVALPGNAKQEIEHVEGDLEEVDVEQIRRERRREQGQARTLHDLVALGMRRGIKKPAGWAAYTAAAREGRKPTGADFKAAQEAMTAIKLGADTEQEAF